VQINLLKYTTVILFFLSFITLSCKAQKNCNNCSTVIAKQYDYDSVENRYVTSEFYSPSTKILYKDSTVIVKAMGLVIITDTSGHTTTEVKLAYYTYIDLTNKSFYQYSSFTDTATITTKFTVTDSNKSQVETVLWSFYDLPIKQADSFFKILPDTSITGVIYKRKSFIQEFIGRNDRLFKNTIVGYYRCDKMKTLFRYGENFSKEEPCPFVRAEFFSLPLLPRSKSLMEVEFVSDTLTSEELKVFDAWKKNAKKYPVNNK
jgi:hypothetical protein